MNEIIIHTDNQEDLIHFLLNNNFEVEDLGEDILCVSREDELPVFLKVDQDTLYFEVDLGNLNEFEVENLQFKLLDLNTEILPVSFGINNTNPEDPRLVLLESRQTRNINDHELLGVFDALELAVDRAESLVSGE
jgi:hypothetical protein